MKRHPMLHKRLFDLSVWGERDTQLRWRKHRWLCLEPMCAVGSFVEQDPEVALPVRLLTTPALRWALTINHHSRLSAQPRVRT